MNLTPLTTSALFSLFISAEKSPLITNCNFCRLSSLKAGKVRAKVGRLRNRLVILSRPFHKPKFVFHVSLWELPKLPGFVMTLLGWGFQAWQSCPCPGSTEPESGLGQAGMGSLQTGRASMSSLLGSPREGYLITPYGNCGSLHPTFVGLNQEKVNYTFQARKKQILIRYLPARSAMANMGKWEPFKAAPLVFLAQV